MPRIEKHAPGTFCWVELATTDQNAAKQFYAPLFGWTSEDSPMGPGEFYTMFKTHGGEAGSAYTMRPQERSVAPPHWNLYIAVQDTDATAKRAAQLGGTVVMQPFDVMTFGRMAVIVDPTGAPFCIWQPKQHIGITVAEEPGTICWADLYTGDIERAKNFYAALFGWNLTYSPNDPGGYLHIQNGEEYIGGIPKLELGEQGPPPNWNVYFLVKDCAGSTEKAKALGGRVFEGPRMIENVGTFSVIADPQGAVFSVFEPAQQRP